MPAALDIVIVSYNARADLEACLTSIHAAPPARPCTVVVVDNASRDGSAEAVAGRWPGVCLIRNPANLGFAAANNVGIRASKGDLVLLLNSDTIVPAGALDRLAAALERNPRAAIAGPRLVDARGVPELSFGRALSPWNEARQRLVGALYDRGVPAVRRWVARRLSTEHWPEWVSGACLLVRRADAEAVGLLDERYFMYGEDVDFCAAVRARGRGVLFTPDAEIVHLRGRSRASAPEATRAAYRRSQIAFYAKHHPRWVTPLRLYLRAKGQLPPASSSDTGAQA
jgi:GT2 family glycosyltransferase